MFWSPRSGGVKSYLRAKHEFLFSDCTVRHSVVVPGAWNAPLPQVPGLPLPFSRGYRFPRGRRSSARALVGMAPDVIEAGDPYQLAWAALDAGQRLGVPVCAFFHSNLLDMGQRLAGDSGRRLGTAYVRKLYPHFDRVFAPSRQTVDVLHGLGVTQAVHQPLGVDSGLFAPRGRSGEWRQRNGIADDTVVLLYVGRFSAEKNLHVLADAVARLGSPYELVAIGDGPVRPSGDRVRVLPYEADRDALAQAYGDADLFLHAGDQETFGLVALEAMACGLPMVGCQRGGIGELVPADAGMTVSQCTGSAFAEAVTALRQRDDAMLRKAARAQAVRYDWRNVLPGLIQHYRYLAHGPDRVSSPAPGAHDAAPTQPVHRHP